MVFTITLTDFQSARNKQKSLRDAKLSLKTCFLSAGVNNVVGLQMYTLSILSIPTRYDRRKSFITFGKNLLQEPIHTISKTV